ncbi:hypothetical protein DZA50_04170 [Kangiella sp. HD9-110m-PIT-SAG07]|nr:hypothetical protein DZA50_04170 [Kangiella sp. HD9-110m-PIT-SAG07]
MSLINRTIIITFATFFLVVCHVWYAGYGIVGLGVQQNNFTWMFVCLVIGLALFSMHNNKRFVMPRFWLLGSVAIIITLLPFTISNKEYFLNGYLLIIGLVAAWIFLLAILQFEAFEKRPDILLWLVFGAIFIQVIWGGVGSFNSVMINQVNERLVVDPAALGVFNQKNVFASFLATGLGLSIFLFCKSEFNNKRIQTMSSFGHIVFAFIAAFTLVYSNSRAGYIGSVISLLFVFPYCFKINKTKVSLWLLFAIMGLVLAISLLESTGRVEKELTEGGSRVGIYLTSFKLMLDAPLLGNGAGSFMRTFIEKFSILNQQGMLPDGSGHGNLVHPHNELLLWGVEGGFISVLGLLALSLILLRHSSKGVVKKLLFLGLLSPIVLHSMVEMPFYQSALHIVVLVLIFVSIYHQFGRKEKGKVYGLNNFNSGLPIVGFFICTASVMFFALNISSLNNLHKFIQQENRGIDELSKVYIHVGWENTYDYMYYGTLYQQGLKSNNPKLIKEYINWANEINKKAPKLDYFRTLVYAYEQLGDIDKAYSTVEKLDFYYPLHKPTQEWIEKFYTHMESKGYSNPQGVN